MISWLLLLVLAVAPSDIDCGENCVEYEQGLRIIETGANTENCWFQDDSEETTNYWDFEVLEFPNGEIATLAINEIEKTSPGSTTYCRIWQPERAGLYSIRVRACNSDGCSRWSDSWDPEHTGHPRGFVYYIKLQAPTGGGIE